MNRSFENLYEIKNYVTRFQFANSRLKKINYKTEISFYRKVYLRDFLINIPGIGSTSAERIMKYFCLTNVKLCQIPKKIQGDLAYFLTKNLFIGDHLLYSTWCQEYNQRRTSSRKSVRLKRNLPINGQRTCTNGKTSKKRRYNIYAGASWVKLFEENLK